MPQRGHLRMPRSVARPRLERKAGVVGVAFLPSLCLAARLDRGAEVCDTRPAEEVEVEETVVSVFIIGLNGGWGKSCNYSK